MAVHRKFRIEEEVKKEIAEIIRNEMKDPRVKGLVSVTHVEVARDMRHATVFLSCLGTEEEQEQSIKAFRQAAGFIRGELAARMSIRYTPELHFKNDPSISVGVRINALLAKAAMPQDEVIPQDEAAPQDEEESESENQ